MQNATVTYIYNICIYLTQIYESRELLYSKDKRSNFKLHVSNNQIKTT